MVNKRQVIIVCFVVIIVGFLAFGMNAISGITGSVITGSVIDNSPVVEDEYFRIDDSGMQVNEMEETNDTQNNSEQR